MTRRIKFHTFHVLFRLFAYLADKSGGWRMFVSPKLLLGSLIVGLGLIGCIQIDAQNQTKKEPTAPLIFKIVPTNSENELPEPMVIDKLYQDSPTFIVVEQMPQFPGGESALLNFVYKNLEYPESAIKDKIQGKVIIRFVVTESGEINKVEVIRSLQPDCDKEAIRVIKLLQKFIPGKRDGKPTKIWFTIPINFKLEKNDVPKN